MSEQLSLAIEEDSYDTSCLDCGIHDSVIWMAPDDLWRAASGFGDRGHLCLECFTTRAYALGIWLCWTPVIREPMECRQPLPDWSRPVLGSTLADRLCAPVERRGQNSEVGA